MRSSQNILIAFILNLSFSIFEVIGGFITGSVAISSDALHDAADALSIGTSYLLERKSKKKPDENYTFGYARYSLVGALITSLILFSGSLIIICNAVFRLISPAQINYDGMIIFAVVGTAVNLLAVFFTRGGSSLNQRAVNLHMLEDVLGWIIVLIGAIVIKLTELYLIDPIMSIGVSVFIMIETVKNLKRIINVFLEKTPENVNVGEIKRHIEKIDGVLGVHHVHIWSINGEANLLTMHIVTDSDATEIKGKIKKELSKYNIVHTTLEIEKSGELCGEEECTALSSEDHTHSHHHCHHVH